jgi:hypothetical protein
MRRQGSNRPIAQLLPRHQSTIINHQSSIINHQSSIINHQSSIINHQSSIINHQSSIINHQSVPPKTAGRVPHLAICLCVRLSIPGAAREGQKRVSRRGAKLAKDRFAAQPTREHGGIAKHLFD